MDKHHLTTENMGVQQRVVHWMLITAVIALILYLGFVFFANANEVIDALSQLKWWWLLAVLLISLLSYGVRALRWNYYLIRLGINMNHRLMFMLYFAGLSMLITPAMISGVVKVGLVKVRLLCAKILKRVGFHLKIYVNFMVNNIELRRVFG